MAGWAERRTMLEHEANAQVSADHGLKQLLDHVTSLVRLTGSSGFYAGLDAFLRDRIAFNQISVLEFRKGMQPGVLFHEGAGYDRDIEEYLNGLYLLDPIYGLYENRSTTGTFQLSLDRWEDFGAEEHYRQYWGRLDGNVEVFGLYEVEPGRCIQLSLMVEANDSQETAGIVETLVALESTCHLLFELHLERTVHHSDDSDDATRREVHFAVSGYLREFGSNVLTIRERGIVQLLLQGHSAKSIARLLEISPGTASIHRSKIYHKLEVSSQGELFSMFVTKLLR